MRQIGVWGVENIADTLNAHNLEIAAILFRFGFAAAVPGSPHLLGLEADYELIPDLAGHLAGAGVNLSVRGRSIRISPHVYNDAEDFELLDRKLEATMGLP